MSKKWQHTDTAVDGTPLFFEDGKYYSQHAWDHFGDAYRGEVRARHHGLKFERWYDGFLAGRDEDTAEMEAKPLDLAYSPDWVFVDDDKTKP